MDSLSISQIHYDSNICFENSPWIQYVFPCFSAIPSMFCETTMSWLSVSRIHNKFKFFFANALLIHYLFCECTMNSLSFSRMHYEFTIYFANIQWIDYLFPESTINPLSISRIYYEITIWFYLKVFHIFKNVFSDLWSRFSRTFFTYSMGSPERHHVITVLSLFLKLRHQKSHDTPMFLFELFLLML